MRKLIALIVFMLSFGFSEAQVTENFDGSSLCSGFLKCWGHNFSSSSGNSQFGISYNSICDNPGNLSINTTTPIGGAGSLRLSYSTTLNPSGGTSYTDNVYTTAYGADGDLISLDIRLTELNIPAGVDVNALNVSVVCGEFIYTQPLSASDIGNIININTVISGSNGGGVIEIIIRNTYSNSFGTEPATVSSVIDIDNFSTDAPLDLTNTCVVTALPVSFNDVKATLRRGGLLVTWATAKETNNDYFKVQLSQNGKDYHELGRVNSKAPNGNSAMPLLYNFSYQLSSSSVSYASMAIIGLLLLSSLLVLMFKNKITRLVLFVIISGSIVTAMACNKAETQKEISKGDKYFVRVAQVDKDGKQSYSKVFQVVDED